MFSDAVLAQFHVLAAVRSGVHTDRHLGGDDVGAGRRGRGAPAEAKVLRAAAGPSDREAPVRHHQIPAAGVQHALHDVAESRRVCK